MNIEQYIERVYNKMKHNLTKMDTDQLKVLLTQIIAIEKGNFDQIIKEHTNE